MKKLSMPKDVVYIVGTDPYNEGYNVIAVFKTETVAKRFIDECQKLQEVKIGNSILDEDDIKSLQIVSNYLAKSGTHDTEFPYFNK